jgi:hypothetical protein
MYARVSCVSCWLALVQDLAVSRSLVQGVLPNISAVQMKSHMDDRNADRTTFNWLLSEERERERERGEAFVAFNMRGLLQYALL